MPKKNRSKQYKHRRSVSTPSPKASQDLSAVILLLLLAGLLAVPLIATLQSMPFGFHSIL